jgi:hypothetical protein
VTAEVQKLHKEFTKKAAEPEGVKAKFEVAHGNPQEQAELQLRVEARQVEDAREEAYEKTKAAEEGAIAARKEVRSLRERNIAAVAAKKRPYAAHDVRFFAKLGSERAKKAVLRERLRRLQITLPTARDEEEREAIKGAIASVKSMLGAPERVRVANRAVRREFPSDLRHATQGFNFKEMSFERPYHRADEESLLEEKKAIREQTVIEPAVIDGLLTPNEQEALASKLKRLKS